MDLKYDHVAQPNFLGCNMYIKKTVPLFDLCGALLDINFLSLYKNYIDMFLLYANFEEVDCIRVFFAPKIVHFCQKQITVQMTTTQIT